MIRINQIKISIFEIGTDREKEKEIVKRHAAALLGCRGKDIRKFRLVRRSVDAREKDDICYVYTADIRLHDSVVGPSAQTELAFVNSLRNRDIRQYTGTPLTLPTDARERVLNRVPTQKDTVKNESAQPETQQEEALPRPVIVGSGPCGLFAAYVFAECGFRPVILERGDDVDTRTAKTERFFESGKLDPDCNIQFGEGGAGTFSDGKLNTSIKDRGGFIEFVLRTFVKFGADPDILIDQKPHVGTDVLVDVIRNMRKYIIEKGGTYLFHSRFDGFECRPAEIMPCSSAEKSAGKPGDQTPDASKQCICAVRYTDVRTGKREMLPCDTLILATGHSARDTYEMLRNSGLELAAKPFAAGIRIQHPQELIDAALYGTERLPEKQEILGPAAYKLTHHAENGRSCFSFCMCPGGYVVNSSSEEGRLCINGMSYHDRASGVANSALIVNIDPEDYYAYTGSEDILSGIEFQRKLEEKAYEACGGVIPYETFREFKEKNPGPAGVSSFRREFLGYAAAADVRGMLPKYMGDALGESIHAFARTIPGYDSDEAIIAGIEARTSSPVRILRDDTRQANIAGIYPAGEGAGYAGGITSAAADGIKTALAVIEALLSDTL